MCPILRTQTAERWIFDGQQLSFFATPEVRTHFDPWTFHLTPKGEVGGRGAFTAWVVGHPGFGQGGTPEQALASLALNLKEAFRAQARPSSISCTDWVLNAAQRLDAPTLARQLASWATEPVLADNPPRRRVRDRRRATTNRP